MNTSIPKNYSNFVLCHIKRDKEGIAGGFTTTFSLYFDGQSGNTQVCLLWVNKKDHLCFKSLLLTAKKHTTITGNIEYFIGTDLSNAPRNLTEENSAVKLRSTNIMGSEYILYDQKSSNNDSTKAQLLGIVYVSHWQLFCFSNTHE